MRFALCALRYFVMANFIMDDPGFLKYQEVNPDPARFLLVRFFSLK